MANAVLTTSDIETAGGVAAALLASDSGAESVGYKWPGAQSVTRLLREKISEGKIVLEDFEGALPDGITDCSPAMDAVLNEMNLGVIGDRQRRLRIKLHSGQYRFTAPIEPGVIQDFALIGPGPELTSLLIDHTDGHGVDYRGGGNARFEGFTIYASDDRYADEESDTLCGFFSDPGVSSTSLMVKVRDVYSYRHPGKGICLINPELAVLEGCRASSNKGRGLHLWGRDISNIMNRVEGMRTRDNGGVGIHSENLDSGYFVNCEALNNGENLTGEYQMRVEGAGNVVIHPDLEMFDHVTGATDYRGLLFTGLRNHLIGGEFYGLNTGIRCANADETLIWHPKLEGKSGAAMTNGIVIDSASDNCMTIVGVANNVTNVVANTSTASTIVSSGRWALPKLAHPAASDTLTAATYTPNMARASSFLLTLTANATIAIPSGVAAGDMVTLILLQDGTGGHSVTLASGYKHTWSDTGNVAGKYSIIEFRALSASVLIQKGAQGPYVG